MWLMRARRGLKVGAWTVNEPADMARLSDLDAICTDRPDLLAGFYGLRELFPASPLPSPFRREEISCPCLHSCLF